MAAAFETLDSVTRQAMFERGEVSEHLYDIYLHHAINFVKYEISLGGLLDPKTVKLSIDENTLTATLPRDFTNWTKVGKICGNEIINLGVNDDMFLNFEYDECGEPRAITDASLDITNYNAIYDTTYPYYNFLGDTLYGKGAFWNLKGYFKVHREQGIIQVSSEVGNEIALEYVTDGLNYKGETLIPIYWSKTCKEYIKYALAQNDMSIAEYKIERLRRDYYAARSKGLMQHKPYTMRDYLDAIRSGYTQAPRI